MFDLQPRTYRTKPVSTKKLAALNASQEKVEGFSIDAHQAAHSLIVGSGAIGSHVCQGLIRKGHGELTCLDDDAVEIQNNTRQLFSRADIGGNKAICIGKNLAAQGMFPGRINCYPLRFLEWVETCQPIKPIDQIVCGVDNNPTRIAVTKYGITHKIPVLHAAVSRDGNQLYVARQIPGEACWGCQFPNFLNDDSYPCNLPGIIDVIQVVAGLVVYAADTILCGRPCEWNLREMFLDGSAPDRARFISPQTKLPTLQP